MEGSRRERRSKERGNKTGWPAEVGKDTARKNERGNKTGWPAEVGKDTAKEK